MLNFTYLNEKGDENNDICMLYKLSPGGFRAPWAQYSHWHLLEEALDLFGNLGGSQVEHFQKFIGLATSWELVNADVVELNSVWSEGTSNGFYLIVSLICSFYYNLP